MFERDGQAVFFGVTAVENIFLTELMPAAKGDFVKVYLSALFHSGQKDEALSLEDFARELGQTPAEVEAALRYWERRGALSYIASDPPVYRLYSLAQRSLTGQDAGPQADEAFVDFSESVYALFGDDRKVRPSEIAEAYEWVVDEGLSEGAVLTLLTHFKNTAGKQFSFRRAGEAAARMRAEGVLSAEDAESYLSFQDSVHSGAQAVLRRLGKRRLPSEEELTLYRKWIREWGFTPEAVLTACRETTAAGDPTFKYLDGILARLRQDGKKLDETQVDRLLTEGDETLSRAQELLTTLGSRARPASVVGICRDLESEHPWEVVLIAARECALAGSHTLDTLQKLLDSWKDKGLTTPEAVEQYIRKVWELDTFLYSVYEACGHTGRPTAADRALAEEWRAAGLPDEVILLAAKEAAGASGRKMAYIKSVLRSWQEAGVRTAEDARKQASARPASSQPQQAGRQVSAQRYTQRDYDEKELEERLGVNDLFKGDSV